MQYELPFHAVVHGATVRYDVSGAGPDVVFVHGNGAHSQWWRPTLRELDGSVRAAVMDLSGHGDSGHRDTYSVATWADDVRAVLEAAGASESLLVGHSMGGLIAVAVAATHPDLLSGIVVFDSPVAGLPPPTRAMLDGKAPPTHATLGAALDRFRLIPHQPHPPADVLAPVARYSVHQVNGEWTWKHDWRARSAVYQKEPPTMSDDACPAVIVYGANSDVVDADTAAATARLLRTKEVVRVEDAAHHVILDQPSACADVIGRTVRRLGTVR